VPHVEDYKLYTRLSRALNHSFGDTGPGEARVSTQKVMLNLIDEGMLRANYVSIVTFPNPGIMEQLTQKHAKEGLSMIEAALKKAQESYGKLFPDEKSIKFELKTDTCKDVVEFISYSAYSPVTRAFYKMNCLVKIK